MIAEFSVSNNKWMETKKQLEKEGRRHANYWTRKMAITADELRKYAMSGKIDAVRVWIGGTPKLYYTIEAVKTAQKLLGR